jgi:hypothetical protein
VAAKAVPTITPPAATSPTTPARNTLNKFEYFIYFRVNYLPILYSKWQTIKRVKTLKN